MATYRRDLTPGSSYFFTVVTRNRQPILASDPLLSALRAAVASVQSQHPFRIDAWVTLPDHMHAVWTLPEGDADYSSRWGNIKRLAGRGVGGYPRAVRSASERRRGESGIWQRRFWEHRIRDEADLRRHLDYVHYNPVKHGLVPAARYWPYSTFHRYVRAGLLSMDWGGDGGLGEFGEPK